MSTLRILQATGFHVGNFGCLGLHPLKAIEELADTTDLSINKIREKLKNKVSRAVVGQIVKCVRKGDSPA